MLFVTNPARAYLAHMLGDPQIPTGLVARFVLERDVVKVGLDRKRAGDTLIDYEDNTVLVFDQAVAKVIRDLTLDVEGSGKETKLKLF
jgi:hypothetical protein